MARWIFLRWMSYVFWVTAFRRFHFECDWVTGIYSSWASVVRFIRVRSVLSKYAMADPSLQSLCCIDNAPVVNRTEQYQLLELYQSPFYGLCLVSSVIGLFGSLYQLSLRFLAPFPRYQFFNVGLRGNNILFWLALADFNANLGKIHRNGYSIYF